MAKSHKSRAKRRLKALTKRAVQLALVLIVSALVYLADAYLPEVPPPFPADPPPTPALTAETAVHFLDVGQGDAALFVSGEQAVLIDASEGGAAEDILAYLAAQGVTKLDAVIATHPHADHIGGMRRVLEAVPTETIYMSSAVTDTQTFDRLLDTIEEQALAPVVPEIGDVLALDSGATFTFLSPDPDETFDDLNNYSLVCLFEAGSSRVLMTGDAETPIEEKLLSAGADIDCDVLKLGHHGSSTSSGRAFLEAASPETVIISCAAVNDYGHPHRETLDTLADLGIDDIRYTYDGAVVIELGEAETENEETGE